MNQNSAAAEIGKFGVLTVTWLSIIFGAVWAVCWLVGVAIPTAIDNSVADPIVAAGWSNALRALVPIVSVMVFIPINAMFMVLCERRALALFTQRKGPNRHGPDGYLQTAADAVKLLFKEDITPEGADAFMFTLAPIIFFAPSIIGVLPLLAAITGNHQLFAIASLPTGIFYVIAVSTIPVVGIVMGAWASNNKYSLVGGLRSAAQAISYEIPLVLSLVTVCLMAQSLDVVTIVGKQGVIDNVPSILNWNIMGGGVVGLVVKAAMTQKEVSLLVVVAAAVLVVCFVLLFGIYITAACAEVNRIPFDLPEAESELVSGYNTEYSGIKFAIFFLAEFTNLFVVCSIATVMFLGGPNSPFAPLDNAVPEAIGKALQALPAGGLGWFFNSLINPVTLYGAFWVIFKTYALVLFAILVRATLPRFRIDQLMAFGWKRLIPLVLILLVLVTFLREIVKVCLL